MMKYCNGNKKCYYMEHQANERSSHSIGRLVTFLGSNVLSSPINQKLSESAGSSSQLPIVLLDFLEMALTSRKPGWVYNGWRLGFPKSFIGKVCLFQLLARLKLPVTQIERFEGFFHVGLKDLGIYEQ